jgi:hypothetical protein
MIGVGVWGGSLEVRRGLGLTSTYVLRPSTRSTQFRERGMGSDEVTKSRVRLGA